MQRNVTSLSINSFALTNRSMLLLACTIVMLGMTVGCNREPTPTKKASMDRGPRYSPDVIITDDSGNLVVIESIFDQSWALCRRGSDGPPMWYQIPVLDESVTSADKPWLKSPKPYATEGGVSVLVAEDSWVIYFGDFEVVTLVVDADGNPIWKQFGVGQSKVLLNDLPAFKNISLKSYRVPEPEPELYQDYRDDQDVYEHEWR